eukprot:1388787-Amorphochlora_amoeboformis.AAC.2
MLASPPSLTKHPDTGTPRTVHMPVRPHLRLTPRYSSTPISNPNNITCDDNLQGRRSPGLRG